MNINLITEEQGYCRQQVDSYVDKLTREYQVLYNEYTALTKQNNDLRHAVNILDNATSHLKTQNEALEETVATLNQTVAALNQAVGEFSHSRGENEKAAIAQALIDARILSQQLISQANVKAAKIIAGAYEELSNAREDTIA